MEVFIFRFGVVGFGYLCRFLNVFFSCSFLEVFVRFGRFFIVRIMILFVD